MRVARRLALALALTLSGAGAAGLPAHAQSAPQAAPLQIVINGLKYDVAVVLLRDGDVLVPAEAFAQLNLSVKPAVQRIGAGEYVSLRSLAPHVRYGIDEATLELRIQADAAVLPRSHVTFDDAPSAAKAGAVPSEFLTYSLASNAFNVSGASGFFQAGWGTPAGLLLASGSASGGGAERGLFSYQTESQPRMSRTTYGDQFAGTDLLGGSAVIAGIGFSREWQFQPNFAFNATPGISGTVLEPSTADIYVNGVYQRTVQLQPGQFDLDGVAGSSGANVTQVVLHDADGNSRTITGSSYYGRSVLAKGLTDYDYNVGFIRPNAYGEDDRYGPATAIGSYRLGVTNFVTLGGHFETTKSLVNGGPTVDVSVPFGVVSLEALMSDANGLGGAATGASFEGQFGRAAVNVTAEVRSENYATIDLAPNVARTRSAVYESVSLPVAARTSLSLTQEVTTFSNQPSALQTWIQASRTVSQRLNLSFKVERDVGGSVFGLQTFGASTGSRWSVSALANIALHGRALAVASETAGPGGGASLSIIQPGPSGIGLSYSLTGTTGSGSSVGGEALYRNQHGDIDFTLDGGQGSETTAGLTLSGSIAAFHGGVLFGEPIYGSYAFAQAPGVAHVPVYGGGELAGRTDGRGLALVTGLTAYQPSTITVGDLSNTDLIAEEPSAVVDPKTYSAEVANLQVKVLRAYFGHVAVNRDGATLVPKFARLTLTGRGREYTVDLGSEGQFYFENLVPGAYTATLLSGDYTCNFPIIILSTDEAITQLGTLTCGVSP